MEEKKGTKERERERKIDSKRDKTELKRERQRKSERDFKCFLVDEASHIFRVFANACELSLLPFK